MIIVKPCEPMDRRQILSWLFLVLQNLMERAKSVAFEQNVIVSLTKNLLWNIRHQQRWRSLLEIVVKTSLLIWFGSIPSEKINENNSLFNPLLLVCYSHTQRFAGSNCVNSIFLEFNHNIFIKLKQQINSICICIFVMQKMLIIFGR